MVRHVFVVAVRMQWERHMRLDLPEFCGQEAGERVVMGYAGESCFSEGRGVIGEVGGAEAGEDAEGEVE